MSIPWGPSGNASGLKGTGYKQVSLSTMNPQQQQLTQMLQGLLGQQGGGFQKGLGDLFAMAGGDQSKFGEMEAPALRQHSQLLGGLASRFSGMGSGARRSSGFQNVSGEATTDLAERLASHRMNYQRDALAQLLGLSDSLLGRPTFQSGLAQKKTPFWKELLLGLNQAGSQAAGTFGGLGLGKWMGLFGSQNPQQPQQYPG